MDLTTYLFFFRAEMVIKSNHWEEGSVIMLRCALKMFENITQNEQKQILLDFNT